MYRKAEGTEWTIIGETFIKGNDRNPRFYRAYKCICSCSSFNVHIVRKQNIDSLKSRSCGCLRKKTLLETNKSGETGRAKVIAEVKAKKEKQKYEQNIKLITAIAVEMDSDDFIDDLIKKLRKIKKSFGN